MQSLININTHHNIGKRFTRKIRLEFYQRLFLMKTEDFEIFRKQNLDF